MTLLSLDRLYTFKSALSSYSRTGSPLRLEDAVDELRRFFLATGGRKISRAIILRSYDWLGATDSALVEVDRMYKRAYGGMDRVGAIDGMGSTILEEPEEEEMMDDYDDDEFEVRMEVEEELLKDIPITIAVDALKIATPKAPILKLQTTFDTKVNGLIKKQDDSSDDGDLTARPTNQPIGLPLWQGASIDEIMNDDDHAPRSAIGPMTPNGYDDISPITRGEWGFLMVGDSWQGGRTVAVETC
jgi:hypothetical protein